MSMCGELENLEREIQMKKTELASLQKRYDALALLMREEKEPTLFDMHIDPAKRNWEYDGYGNRVPKGDES